MHSNFDYIKMNPQYYFSSWCVRFFFARLLREGEENVDFSIRDKKNVIQTSRGWSVKCFLICFE